MSDKLRQINEEELSESEGPDVDWEESGPRPKPSSVPGDFGGLALADGDGPVERPAAKPAPPAEKPTTDKPAATDKPAQKLEAPAAAPAAARREVMEANIFAAVPRESINSVQRAIAALSQVQTGRPLSAETRRAFEDAMRDAGLVDPAWARDQAQRLTADIDTKDRRLPNGMILPPWTPEKEQAMWEKMGAAAQALQAVPEPTRTNLARLDAELKNVPAHDLLQRTRVEQALQAEARSDTTGKGSIFLLRRNDSEQFQRENAMGIMRRNIHQQEMSLLNGRAMTQGLYALAMDRAGQESDRKSIQDNLKAALANPFVITSAPELMQLRDKYGVRETDPLDARVPGRASLRHAMEIMSDERQGTLRERLEKAKPLFEQAIGASSSIDCKAIDQELEKLGKEAAEMGEGGDPRRREELGARITELIEQRRMPGLAAMAYATTLNHASVDLADRALNDQALAFLRRIEQNDPGAKYDPMLQGAIKTASEGKKITEQEALALGGPIVDRLKEEAIAAGKNPEDEVPTWRKILGMAGNLAVSVVGFEVLRRVLTGGGSATRRGVELWRRTANLEIDRSLPAGERGGLYFRDAEGRELPVEGVRREDGRLRIRNGEVIEAVANKGKLIYKLPADSTTSDAEARQTARRTLTPTRTEMELGNANRTIEQQQKELEELRRQHEELRRQFEGNGGSTPSAERPAPSNLNDVERRGLDAAKELRARQAELRITNNRQVADLLRSTLENIDERSGEQRWNDGDRQKFVDLIDRYARGDAQAVQEVNRHLGIEAPATGNPAASRPTEVASASGSAAYTDADLQSLKDLERSLGDPARRARVVAELTERGQIRQTLEAKVSRERAADLERRLLSERAEEVREARAEIGRIYAAEGGVHGFGRQLRGRLGAMALLAAAALPFLFSRDNSREDDRPATWR